MDLRKWLSGASGSPPSAPTSPSTGYPSGGSPGVTPATNPGPYWFHQIGEELRAVVVAGGQTPDQGNLTQLLTALQALFGTVLSNAGVPYGVRIYPFIIQLKQVTFTDVPAGVPGYTGSATWQTAFPTACLAVFPGFEVASGGSAYNDFQFAVTAKSTTGCSFQIQEWVTSVNPGTLNLLAIGY